ncbi:MAG: aldose 1-epimerase [Candidatus Limnocylindrales bacterium]
MILLRADGVSARIDSDRGGRLASLAVGGRELLVGPPDAHGRSLDWGCFLMAPWVGRIADAQLAWRGRRHRLPRTMGRHAIHGVVYDRPWSIDGATADEATLTCLLGDTAWPFAGLVRQHVSLAQDRLTMTAEIVADEPMPASLGWHPWFARGDGDVRLTVDAARTLELRALIPTGRTRPVDERTDLRAGPPLGERALDDVYLDVVPPAIVRRQDVELRIGFDAPLTTLVIYTTPVAVCVEPQSAWPDATSLAARGRHETGLVELETGDRLAATMSWTWRLP